ncbi:hypothetical protein RQP46_005630 [Phenoliferia psychrophenolica]
MHTLQALSLLLPLAHLVASTSIIFPLYFDPDPTTCYPALRSAAAAHPHLSFVLILNPNSGPTTDPTSSQLACIPSLRSSIPNAKIIGYVPTGYGTRPAADVQRDITTYKSWGKIRESGKLIPIDGVFFDEVNDDAGRMNYALYLQYRGYAKSAFGGATFIVMNPGTAISSRFYALANLLVTFESAYSEWKMHVSSLLLQAALATSLVLASSGSPPILDRSHRRAMRAQEAHKRSEVLVEPVLAQIASAVASAEASGPLPTGATVTVDVPVAVPTMAPEDPEKRGLLDPLLGLVTAFVPSKYLTAPITVDGTFIGHAKFPPIASVVNAVDGALNNDLPVSALLANLMSEAEALGGLVTGIVTKVVTQVDLPQITATGIFQIGK